MSGFSGILRLGLGNVLGVAKGFLGIGGLPYYALAAVALLAAGAYASKVIWADPQITIANQRYNTLKAQYDAQVTLANAGAQNKTDDNTSEVKLLNQKLKELQDESKRKEAKLRSQAKVITQLRTVQAANGSTSTITVSSGGLYLARTSCDRGQRTPGEVSAGTDPGTTAGAGDQAQCRLAEPTANALISIAADGDAAINQLNKVLDAYNKVQANGCWVTTPSTGLGLKPSPKRE